MAVNCGMPTPAITRVVQIGCDVESARWTADAVTRYPQMLGGVALHPNDAAQLAAEGRYADAFAEVGGDFLHEKLRRELAAVKTAGSTIRSAGMRFNAGHALNYHNVQPIAALDGVAELHIGHAIVSRAIFDGLRNAVAEMKRLMVQAANR